jgi:hypothetical protein
MPRLIFAASLMAALVLAACGGSTPPPSQPADVPPSQPAVSAPPASPAPSTSTDPSTPKPADPTAKPVVTPAPTVRPTPKPTPRPTEPTFSRAERYLIDGIMRGESDCSPVRGGRRPGDAIAGIDCDVVGSPVARAGYYLFRNDADMLDAYLARMAAEGIALETGGCEPGEGEGAYIPYGDGDLGPDRHGCFLNSEGYGNYRATIAGAHVYIGLLGRSPDMRSLEDWAWFGSQDTPGSPTLWYQDFVYRP